MNFFEDKQREEENSADHELREERKTLNGEIFIVSSMKKVQQIHRDFFFVVVVSWATEEVHVDCEVIAGDCELLRTFIDRIFKETSKLDQKLHQCHNNEFAADNFFNFPTVNEFYEIFGLKFGVG